MGYGLDIAIIEKNFLTAVIYEFVGNNDNNLEKET